MADLIGSQEVQAAFDGLVMDKDNDEADYLSTYSVGCEDQPRLFELVW
jgi:hypothetical protein